MAAIERRKSATVAAPDFNRRLVPPAALAIHLSIGMACGFSVAKLRDELRHETRAGARVREFDLAPSALA